ncbi:hypothetical protein FACS1894177_06380 [Bacteroidia bacterium]|nr:hypothetical protein FACS1894177_06380 [Bacteroidia bacterium]
MLNDKSPMPWGKFKGEKMEDVPADYLLWLYREDKADTEVLVYINDNYLVLLHEVQTMDIKKYNSWTK